MKTVKRFLNTGSLQLMLLFFTLLTFACTFVCADEHSTVYNGTDYAKVYDYDYYTTNTRPDLSGRSDKEVLGYFVKTGISEGDQAIESFSVKSYRNANQDLRGKYGNDYEKYVSQYLKSGYSQDRVCVGFDNKIKDPVTTYDGKSWDRVYDFNYYIAHNSKVRKKYALDDFGAIEYFVKKGMSKKHQAIETFNVTWYYNKWSALRYNWSTNWPKYYDYYQRRGYRKGITTPLPKIANPITYYKYGGKKYSLSQIYDFEYYTKHNSSAYQFWKNQDDCGAIKHFVNYGMLMGYKAREGVSETNKKYVSLRKKLHPNLNTNAYFKANDYSSRTKWLILLNQAECKVYVFKGEQGSWTCDRVLRCTVGKPSTPTPAGVYTIGGKGLYFDSGSVRAWYYTQMVGQVYFHSITYTQEPSPIHVADGRIGQFLSHGCIRLPLADAKWFQSTIPYGTTVVSYNRPF